MRRKNPYGNPGRYFSDILSDILSDIHSDGTKYISIVNKKMFGRHK